MQIYVSLASFFCESEANPKYNSSSWSNISNTEEEDGKKKHSPHTTENKNTEKKNTYKTEIRHLIWFERCVTWLKWRGKRALTNKRLIVLRYLDRKYNLEHQLWFGCQTSSFCIAYDFVFVFFLVFMRLSSLSKCFSHCSSHPGHFGIIARERTYSIAPRWGVCMLCQRKIKVLLATVVIITYYMLSSFFILFVSCQVLECLFRFILSSSSLFSLAFI